MGNTLEQAMLESELALADETLITPVNECLLIDPETRLIEVPESESLFGVYSENDVEVKHFACPKIVLNNIDLSQMYIFINYVSASGRYGQTLAKNIKTSEDGNYITFDWELTGNVFDLNTNGKIYFAVMAKKQMEDKKPVFATRKASGDYYETIEAGEVIQEQQADIILEMLTRIEALEKGGTGGSSFGGKASDVSYDDTKTKLGVDNVQDAISKVSEEIVDYNIEPKTDDIPKVFIDGVIPTTKDEVLAVLTYVSKTETFKAYIKIKCQGTSSMAYDKKNFTIKLYSDEARETKLKKLFKDWKFEESKFVLKANWIDHSHARNIVCARLWNEVVASRSDYDSLPQELKASPKNGAIDGFPVKVYTNGTYKGLYTWNIGKDDWMWNMDEDNPNHVLLCAETNGGRNTYVDTPCNFRSLWNGVNEKDWSVEVGTNSEAVKNSLNNLITFVMENDGESFVNGIENYLDIQSAIDYYIMQYVICGTDGLAKNMLLATYDGTKWICGAYDMDSVFGLWWNGVSFAAVPTFRCPEDYQEPNSLLWERIETNFAERLKSRYFELRNTVLSFSNMTTHFERFVDVIGSELYAEDLDAYPNIPLADSNNIKQIREYIRDRLAYVDSEFENIGVQEVEEITVLNGVMTIPASVSLAVTQTNDEITIV